MSNEKNPFFNCLTIRICLKIKMAEMRNVKKIPPKTNPQDVLLYENVNFISILIICDITIKQYKFKISKKSSNRDRTAAHLSCDTCVSQPYQLRPTASLKALSLKIARPK